MITPKVYLLEPHNDFINKETQAQPINALAELVWNSLDADATRVDIIEDNYGLDHKRIIVTDNGHGFSHEEAPKLFSLLGGSWKRLTGLSKSRRFLHGAEGKGRLKAFALGRVIDWEICYRDNKKYKRFTISMLENALREVRVGQPENSTIKQTGVRCIISELRKEYEFLQSPNLRQEMSEIFATYLKNYNDVQINLPTGKLDVSVAIAANQTINLDSIVEEGIEYLVSVELIEWKNETGRVLYLCNEGGLPLSSTDLRVHAPGLNFSAYIKSAYISKLSSEGTLGLGELNQALTTIITQAKEKIKLFYRERMADKSQTVVNKWKEESVYPFQNEPMNSVERIEREIFDIVAVKVSDLVPDFDSAPQKGKKLQLRMLRQAIEKSPEDLQLILTEVLELPEKRQKEFAKLLRETSLTAIINASTLVADRLKFLKALETLLFDIDEKKGFQERTQLHRLLAQNTWIFGEEFSLSVDDQSLTEVLRTHLQLLEINVRVDKPVLRADGRTGIIDLMLTRKIPSQREDELDHLIVELKRPTVKIGAKEIAQIKDYAFSVAEDSRFSGVKTRWTFWIISNDMDSTAKRDASQANRPAGMLYQSEDKQITVWAKIWGEVLHANRQRLRSFQASLELSADKDQSLKFLRETYANVVITPLLELVPADDDANEIAKLPPSSNPSTPLPPNPPTH